MSRSFGPSANTGGAASPSNSSLGGSFGPGPSASASVSASSVSGSSPAKKSGKKPAQESKKGGASPHKTKSSANGPPTTSAQSGAGFGPGRVGAGPPPPSGESKADPVSPQKKSASPVARAHGPGAAGPPSRPAAPPRSPGRGSELASPVHGSSHNAVAPHPVAQKAVPKAPSTPHDEIAAPAPKMSPSGKKESAFPPNAPPNYGRNPTFLNGKPNIPFNFAYPCFEEENGVMFRLIDESAGVWAFYNDSIDYDVTVYMSLGEESKISPIGGVRLPFSDSKKAYEGRVVIPPRTTVPVLKGTVSEYNLYFKATALTV